MGRTDNGLDLGRLDAVDKIAGGQHMGGQMINPMFHADRVPNRHVEAYQLSTKAGRQSTLGYTHGSSLSVDGAQTTNSMVTQDTDKLFIQVRPPSWRNTYVLRLVVLICVERIMMS